MPAVAGAGAPRLHASRRRLLVAVGACWSLLGVVRVGEALAARELPARPAVVPIRVDLNRASVAELMTLEGIGRARAFGIVLHRVRHGPFRTVDDLARVDGIGPMTVAALRAHARAGEAAAAGGSR